MNVGSVASSDSGHNVLADSGYGSISQHPLNTILASLAGTSLELVALTPPGLRTRRLPGLTTSQSTAPSSEGHAEDLTMEDISFETEAEPTQSTVKPRPQPMPEQLLNAWDPERRQCIVVEEPTGDSEYAP